MSRCQRPDAATLSSAAAAIAAMALPVIPASAELAVVPADHPDAALIALVREHADAEWRFEVRYEAHLDLIDGLTHAGRMTMGEYWKRHDGYEAEMAPERAKNGQRLLQIVYVVARTPAGIAAKALVLRAHVGGCWTAPDEPEDAYDRLAWSLARDALAVGGAA